MLAVVAAVACGPKEEEVPSSKSLGIAFLKLPDNHAEQDLDRSFEVLYPAGYGINQVVVGASEDLDFGASNEVIAIDGTPGTVTSTGGDTTSLGIDTRVGDVISSGDIWLQAKARARTARSSGDVHLGLKAQVATKVEHATLIPFARRTIKVHRPSGTPSDLRVDPGGTATLAPGSYADVTVGPNASLTLSAGTYVLDRFYLGHDAELHLDTTAGSIHLHVERDALWNGHVTGDATRFVFGYLGQGAIQLDDGFRGTALVPAGRLLLGSFLEPLLGKRTVMEGTFYGKHVGVAPRTTLKKLATPFLIDELKLDRSTLCIGESAEVTITSPPNAVMRIMGVVGPHQFVQFANAPGKRSIWATARTPDGRADFTSIPVSVSACDPVPGIAPPIALHFWGASGKPYAVELVVHDYDAKGREVMPSESGTYVWSFGDGQTLTTTSPFVQHDYTSAVDPLREYNHFNASVTRTSQRGATTTRKVIPVWSLYAKNRSKGIVQPPSTLTLSPAKYDVKVTNHEPTPITLTEARVEVVPCDPALPVRRQAPESIAVSIPARTTAAASVTAPPPFSADVCNIGVHLKGSSAAGTVVTDSYVRLQENGVLLQNVTSPSTVALLNRASALTRDRNRFDELELRQLVADGRLEAVPPAVPPGVTYAGLNESCIPGQEQPGLVCQPTDDWVVSRGEIINAFKGEIVMDHGCGEIGKLLAAVNQRYSHNSVITTSRVEVRHSTASTDMMVAAVEPLELRLNPETLRFGYPGTEGAKTHTISEMSNRYCVTALEHGGLSVPCVPDDRAEEEGRQWMMGNELTPRPSRCVGDITAVPALVVRPPPYASAANFQSIASMANPGGQLFAINSHYRFFHYSRSDLVLPGAGWAQGTEANVCSSFSLQAASRTSNSNGGLGLPLWPTNPARLSGVPDGMTDYTVDERLAAGNAVHENMSNLVLESCDGAVTAGLIVLGGQVGLVGGAAGVTIGSVAGGALCEILANRIGNQVANCFGNDRCGDTSATWERPGKGTAVSPDDILDWDLPENGGTYGYNEPMQFLPTVFRRKYVWRQAAGSGSMTVEVRTKSDLPYADATIILNGLVQGTTGSDGILKAPALAQGNYDVEAQYNRCGSPDPPPAPLPFPQLPNVGFNSLPECYGSEPKPPPGPACRVTQPTVCPSGWRNDGCVTLSPDRNGVNRVACVCVGPPPPPPPRCCRPLEVARRQANVAIAADTRVLLTLCAGPDADPLPNPQTCMQACTSNADCKDNLTCHSCFPPEEQPNFPCETGFCFGEPTPPCKQRCYVDADCDPHLRCDGGDFAANKRGLCSPQRRVVRINGSSSLQGWGTPHVATNHLPPCSPPSALPRPACSVTFPSSPPPRPCPEGYQSGGCATTGSPRTICACVVWPPPQYAKTLDIRCDPHAPPPTTPVFSHCGVDPSGVFSGFQVDLYARCFQDLNRDGELFLHGTARLFEGCGSHPPQFARAVKEWDVPIPPLFSATAPIPTVSQKDAVCHRIFTPDACSENSATFDLVYSNVPP